MTVSGTASINIYPQLPTTWVNNNEGNTAFSYELVLGSGSWMTGPPPTCSFSLPYVITTVGLQSAINALEACRTLTGVGIALDIPPGLYTSAHGLVIPQTRNSISSNFLILRSTQDARLPNGRTVCAHGIQDNLATSSDIGLINPGCNGQNLAFQGGQGASDAKTITQLTLAGVPQLTFPYTLANSTVINSSDYNDVQYMWTVEVSGQGAAIHFCDPVDTGANQCNGSIGPDHWLIQDLEARPSSPNPNIVTPIELAALNTESSISQYPSHIHLRKVWAHGDCVDLTTSCSNNLSSSINFVCVYCSIVDSQTSQAMRPGNEGHGITANGTMYKIDHNWLEGQSSGLLSGGVSASTGPSIQGYVMFQDDEIRRNRFTFPYAWLGVITFPLANVYWGGTATTVVNTSGTAVTWVSGPQFSTLWQTKNIKINGTNYTVSTYNSATSVTLTATAGTQSGVSFVVNPPSIFRKTSQENKELIRAVYDGNIFENVDNSGGQNGTITTWNIRNAACATGKCQNYQSTIQDWTVTNNIFRNGCGGPSIGRSTSATGSGGGTSYAFRNFIANNDLWYNISTNNPGCAGSLSAGFQLFGPGSTWQGNITCNTATPVICTFVAVCSIDEGDCPTGPPSAGAEAMDYLAGDPVSISGCTGNTALNDVTKDWGSGHIFPTQTQAHATGASAPWCTAGTCGPWNTTMTTVTYSGTIAVSGASDNTNTCLLSNREGNPINWNLVHSTYITDVPATIGAGNSLSAGPNFQMNTLFRNDIMLSPGPTSSSQGWYNSPVGHDGTPAEIFGYDINSMSANYIVWPYRDNTHYTEYGNNPSFPDSAGCTGTGCNPPITMYFPPTPWCTAATVGGSASCVGFIGAMSLPTGPMPVALPDYHQYALRSDSSYFTGAANAASDGKSMGADISAIDAAQTLNQYVCSTPCGSPGPYPDN